MTDRSADAALGLLVVYAMDMYHSSSALNPAPDPRLAPEWIVRGYLTAFDAVFRQGPLQSGARVCYGFLAQSAVDPLQWVAVIRGTDGLVAWLEDAEFAQVPHPAGGHAEVGFYGLYGSMQLDGVPAAQAIASRVGKGRITVVGHSLGSALATFLTLDLAKLFNVRGRFFASPHPGDADFEAAFDRSVADYMVYAYSLDVVPHVPFGFGYTALRNLTIISTQDSQARIRLGLDCSHHIVDYCAALDYNLADWSKFPAQDLDCVACIKGPSASV